MSPRPLIQVERRGPVAWVRLDRPEAANALSRALVADLGAALAAVRADPDVRAIVLGATGGKAFCAGADLKERQGMSPDDTRAFLAELGAVLDAIESSPRPVVAAIGGAALGGGLELALACDIRLAGEAAVVGLPEVRLGIIPGAGGTQRLARLCGVAAAREMILTGRRIDAARAREIGLVSAVVPAGQLDAEAERWATEIAEAGPLALREAKRAVDQGFGRPLPEGLAIERERYEVVLASDDRKEGLAAFAEKRKPIFRGK